MNQFPRELQAKQFVAVVQNGTGLKCNVYETGNDKYYLFRPLVPGFVGIEGGIEVPILKKELQPKIKRMLANGCGNAIA